MTDKRITRKARRRGSIYLIVLGVAMIVSILGICGVLLARIQLKSARATTNRQTARILAQSAVDHAVSIMDFDPFWRNSYKSNELSHPWSFGDQPICWKLVDEDGDLKDDDTDPVWIYGIGQADNAVWVARARARINAGLPYEFLRTALHAAKTVEVKSNKTLTVVGAPVSTDTNLDLKNGSVIDGDAEAVLLVGSGTVTGTATAPAEKKGVPPRSVFDDYVARATPLPYNGNLNKVVLGPGVNEYGGGLNEDGVYYLNTLNNYTEIKNSRIYGTLVVDAGSGEFVIWEECFIHPFREDFPSLIIKGTGYIMFMLTSNAGVGRLSELSEGHNFNPAGALFQGVADNDLTDDYPCEIRGLVHIIGSPSLKGTTMVRGCVVVDGAVEVDGTPRVVHDSNLMLNPPLDYTDDPGGRKMIIEPGSWSSQPAQ